MTNATPPKTIACIGLGLMGSAFSERLLKRGYAVHGFDINAARRRELEARGGTAAASSAEAARGAGGVLTALMTAEITRAALLGPDGALSALAPGALVLDTGTVHPDEAEALANEVRARGFRMLEAAIAGSSRQVRNAEAVALVGGRAADVAAAESLLRDVVRRAHHLGPSGAGARAKLVVNLVLGLNRLALSEGLLFAERQGLDLARMLAVLKDSPARAQVLEAKGPKMLAGTYRADAKLAQHRKDVGLILNVAKALNCPLPVSALHEQLLAAGVAQGFGEADNSAILEVLRGLAALPPRRTSAETAGS